VGEMTFGSTFPTMLSTEINESADCAIKADKVVAHNVFIYQILLVINSLGKSTPPRNRQLVVHYY
jgi:hypothetical protein